MLPTCPKANILKFKRRSLTCSRGRIALALTYITALVVDVAGVARVSAAAAAAAVDAFVRLQLQLLWAAK